MRSRPFRFKLQKVLDYRIHLEDKLKAELAELHLEHERLESYRETLRQSVADAIEHLRQGEFDLLQIHLTTRYVDRLERSIANLSNQILQVQARIEEKTSEVIEASRDRKVMERLRERALEEYRAETLRIEQAFLDELGTVGFNRSRALTRLAASEGRRP